MTIFAFFIIKPFVITIITSIILSYMFYPVYKFINKRIKQKNLVAFMTTLVVIITITVPLIFAMNAVASETRSTYIFIKQSISGTLDSECDPNFTVCRISNFVTKWIAEPKIRYYLDNSNEKITNAIIDNISSFLFSIPVILLNLFVMLFILFFMFRDGTIIIKKIENLSPLKELHYKKILAKFNEVIRAVIFGYIFIAIIEAVLGTAILLILGINAPVLLGLMMGFFAIIPIIGPPVIWLPISLFMILDGYTTNTSSLVVKGVILLIYGTLIITPVDTILKPKVIGDKANVHPILILLGVLGGLRLFGMVGIIIGPVILAVFMTFLSIYEEEKGALI